MKMLTAPEWAYRAMTSLVPDESGAGIPFDELRNMLQIAPTFCREYLKKLGIDIDEDKKLVKARWRWEET
ncbi:TPA: hypothetical protein QIY66_000642 [Raoultella planticola]|uniref:hypothetical protein n=1 Tax=Raoultella ornithinolytica TaxID=54291 RepID=UPI0007DAE279|nr:hypothetical protein [Raoultella ornithinolytica]HDV8886615.1 hypothetical protein [Raoultella planticola]